VAGQDLQPGTDQPGEGKDLNIEHKKKGKRKVAGQDLQPGTDQPGEGKDLNIEYIPDEKIEIEIREIVRIHPKDFHVLKASFEDWIKTWN